MRFLRYASMAPTARRARPLVAHYVSALGDGYDPTREMFPEVDWPRGLVIAERFVPLCYARRGDQLIGAPVDLFNFRSRECAHCLRARRRPEAMFLHEYCMYEETVHLMCGAVTEVWDHYTHALRTDRLMSPHMPRRAYAEV